MLLASRSFSIHERRQIIFPWSVRKDPIFSFREKQFDLSLMFGVVNHTANPMSALSKILAATRYASVLALWVTAGKEGFWAIIYSVLPSTFSHMHFGEPAP